MRKLEFNLLLNFCFLLFRMFVVFSAFFFVYFIFEFYCQSVINESTIILWFQVFFVVAGKRRYNRWISNFKFWALRNPKFIQYISCSNEFTICVFQCKRFELTEVNFRKTIQNRLFHTKLSKWSCKMAIKRLKIKFKLHDMGCAHDDSHSLAGDCGMLTLGLTLQVNYVLGNKNYDKNYYFWFFWFILRFLIADPTEIFQRNQFILLKYTMENEEWRMKNENKVFVAKSRVRR